jgi:single-stranded-DNA-specific exonuclease
MSAPSLLMRWTLPEIPEDDARKLAARCGLELPAARVLWARGYRDPHDVERFLHPKLSDLADPFLLLDMDKAADRIRRAARDHEHVLIYGDYDVDGTSSIVILKKMLELMGLEAGFHVPDRLKDGYGIQESVLEQARRDGVTLLISVDTGIRALEPLQAARDLGIDVIVTDHHLPESELPPAHAILNPNRPDCPYPNKNLCGAGVTFKLIQALMERERWTPDRIVRFSDSFLVLVAIATVADVVPLTGENRVIVQRGLEGLRKTRNPGLRALLAEAGLPEGEPVSAADVGFRIAPRINAAGRMDHAADVIELFHTSDEARAGSIAARLDALNSERQRTCETIVEQILEEHGAEAPPPDRAGLVFYDPEWHRGVVGIVANRIAELFNRPTLVLGRDEASGLAQGSGRSIPSFHLLEALESMSDLFVRFGGHRQAVGLTLDSARVAELRERFNACARRSLDAEGLAPERVLDAELQLDELTDRAAEEILSLAPFGLGNRLPVFLLRDARVAEPVDCFGRAREHLRVRLGSPATQRTVVAKAWRFSARSAELVPGASIDVALTIDEDNYSARRGYSRWAATLRDVRAT